MPVDCICTQCGKQLKRSPSDIRRYKNVFCSLQCKSAYYVRDKNPNGIYSLEQFNILKNVFEDTGNIKIAAKTSGIDYEYAKGVFRWHQKTRLDPSKSMAGMFYVNMIYKYSIIGSKDYTNEFIELAKLMPDNLQYTQAKTYIIGYCHAKNWSEGVKKQLFRLIHRAYKLKLLNNAV